MHIWQVRRCLTAHDISAPDLPRVRVLLASRMQVEGGQKRRETREDPPPGAAQLHMLFLKALYQLLLLNLI